MIKINIDEISRREMEQCFWDDANSRSTGVVTILKTETAKKILKNNHIKIYETLYDVSSGELNIAETKRLLLASRQTMEKYIEKWGEYSDPNLRHELLDKIFRYDTYSSRVAAVKILKKMNIMVCPYCNRQYIITLSSGKIRPQFDHYFPKSTYPYLALSLYNMVPSCSVCNMAKSSLDTVKTPILYPFTEEVGNGVEFEIRRKRHGNFVRMLQGVSDEFEININIEKATNKLAISTQINSLHLDDLYNEHKEYIMDIIKSKYINSAEYINELLLSYPMLFHSYEDVKSILYMNSIKKEDWGNRPLAKLTHDIDAQLEKRDIDEA